MCIRDSITITIKEDEIFLDFTDNVPQVKGALNLTETALRACVYYSLKCIIDPTLPSNGCLLYTSKARHALSFFCHPQSV